MNSEESQWTDVIEGLRRGDHVAARRLWVCYYDHLLELSRANLPSDLRRREDEEDVVQSVFRTFFRRVAQGQFEMSDLESLEKLLVTITLNKSRDRLRRHLVAKRDVRREVQISDNRDVGPSGHSETHVAMPEERVLLQEALDVLLNQLDSLSKDIVLLKMDGYTNTEIAETLDRSERTIERRLRDIRKTWRLD